MLQQKLLVAGVVGDGDAVAVPTVVFSRRLNTVVFHESDVALHQLTKIPRRHFKRVLVSSAAHQRQNSVNVMAWRWYIAEEIKTKSFICR